MVLDLVSHLPTMMPLYTFVKSEASIFSLRLLELEGGDRAVA